MHVGSCNMSCPNIARRGHLVASTGRTFERNRISQVTPNQAHYGCRCQIQQGNFICHAEADGGERGDVSESSGALVPQTNATIANAEGPRPDDV
jgi:hypothetical protein